MATGAAGLHTHDLSALEARVTALEARVQGCVRSFPATGTAAQFLALMADMTIDVIDRPEAHHHPRPAPVLRSGDCLK